MIASGRDMSPPAPMPWIARKPASISIDVENDAASEPTTKIVMAKMYSGRRPNRSLSFP
jgi:hypothetical protein